MSGGEPRETQDNTRVEPTVTIMDDELSIVGVTMRMDHSNKF